MFKRLIFVQGLMESKDGEIRVRISRKLEQDSKLTLKLVADKCQRIINPKRRRKNWKKLLKYIDVSTCNGYKKSNPKPYYGCE